MRNLFTYGTLQKHYVQEELIGRIQEGDVDAIEGFVVTNDYFVDDDFYPRLIPFLNGIVYGRVMQFTDEEIAVLDEYESEAYERVVINTKMGREVEVYMPVQQ
jgi:gamma-glutamylcyclotransferase (GGCT)/AIG2-like uncharacterized protein YtfP